MKEWKNEGMKEWKNERMKEQLSQLSISVDCERKREWEKVRMRLSVKVQSVKCGCGYIKKRCGYIGFDDIRCGYIKKRCWYIWTSLHLFKHLLISKAI